MLKYGSDHVTRSMGLWRVSEPQEAVFCQENCVEQFSIIFSSEVCEIVLYESILVSPTEPIYLIWIRLLNYHKVKYNTQYFLDFKGDTNLQVKMSWIF
jgi:hypothetical protein